MQHSTLGRNTAPKQQVVAPIHGVAFSWPCRKVTANVRTGSGRGKTAGTMPGQARTAGGHCPHPPAVNAYFLAIHLNNPGPEGPSKITGLFRIDINSIFVDKQVAFIYLNTI